MNAITGAVNKSRWYYGWNIVAICILAQAAANALPISSFSLFLKYWSADLRTPISTLQLGVAACGLGCAVLSPLFGVFADKYSARVLFGIGVSGIAVFCLAISYVTATWQYIALYATLAPAGILLSTTITSNALISRWFVQKLGLALGLTFFGLGLAGVIIPPIVAAALHDIGWRSVWRIAAAVTAFIILPLILLVLKDLPTEQDGLEYLAGGDGSRGDARHGGGGGGGGGHNGLRYRDVLARKNFWLLVFAYLPLLAIYGGAGQNLAPIALSRGLTQQTAGALLAIFGLAQLGGTLLAGLLSDHFSNRLPLSALSLCAALGGVTLALGHNLVLIGLGAAFAGIGGGFWPLLAAAMAREFGSRFGTAFGLALFFLPAVVLAPFVVAKFQESSGSYGPALMAMSVWALMGCGACLLMRERPRGAE